MVATSQNGYFANNRSLITSVKVPGGKLSCRKDYGIPVIVEELANRFHNEVEALKWPGCWGYAERPIRGSTTTLSNHASGTAWDFNAPDHWLGERNTFSNKQEKAIRKILKDFDGVLRWGGDYSGRKDEMHFEINKNEAACERLAKKISGNPTKPSKPSKPSKPKPKPKPKVKEEGIPAPKFPYGNKHYIGRESNSAYSHSGALARDRDEVRQWQQRMDDRGWTIVVDGRFGPDSEKVARQFQRQIRVTVDGKVGAVTWRESWEADVT